MPAPPPGCAGGRAPDARQRHAGGATGPTGPRITTGPGAPYTVDVTDAVSWDVAQRVATWVGGRRSWSGAQLVPSIDAATAARLEEDFAEVTAQAEALVIEATGLRPASGEARARVVDRPGWVKNNLSSFRHLLDPVLGQLETATLKGPLPGVAQSAAGAQLGLVLGWMSTRVLGQYDLLFAGDTSGDAVSYVGPNIVALERRHGFPPRQFRLWIALHEVTHRCQFTGVPWLRGYFLSQVDQVLSHVTPDPHRMLEALGRAAQAVRQGRNPLEDAGVLGLVAPPEQLEVIARIQAMMSVLEGHGDVTMDRAGAEAVPDAAVVLPGAARAAQQRTATGAAPAAAGRDRGQDASVPAGGELHPGGGGDRRPRGPGSGLGGSRAAADHRGDPPPRRVVGAHGPDPARRRLMVGPGADRPDDRHGPPPGTTVDELLARCTFPPAGTALVCAVSGGADSLALLVLACATGAAVTAVHVDHGLRPESAGEAEIVVAAARRFGAAFRAETAIVAPGANLEARARAARRAAVGPGAATGHTMDDQAETVVLNLLRGAGLDGLAAMRPGPAHPILGLRRSETRALCAGLALDPVYDRSNDDPRFRRNRIRHELLPLCADIAGRDVVPVLARQAGLLGAEGDLLDALAAGIDPADAAALGRAPGPLARRATRRWLRGDGPYPPDLAAVERVLSVARGETRATDVAPGVRVRRARGRLSVAPVVPGAAAQVER